MFRNIILIIKELYICTSATANKWCENFSQHNGRYQNNFHSTVLKWRSEISVELYVIMGSLIFILHFTTILVIIYRVQISLLVTRTRIRFPMRTLGKIFFRPDILTVFSLGSPLNQTNVEIVHPHIDQGCFHFKFFPRTLCSPKDVLPPTYDGIRSEMLVQAQKRKLN